MPKNREFLEKISHFEVRLWGTSKVFYIIAQNAAET